MGRYPWLMRAASWAFLAVFGVAPLLSLFFRLARGEATYGEGITWVIVAICGLMSFLVSQVVMMTTEFGVTDQRVIFKSGIVSRHANEITLRALENVNLHQGFWSRLFGFGHLAISGSGGSAILTHPVQDPLALRGVIAEARMAKDQRLQPRGTPEPIDPTHNRDHR